MDLDFCWMGGFANCIPTLGENNQYNAKFICVSWAIVLNFVLLWLTLLSELVFAFTGRNKIVSMKDRQSL
jgi:hypothetical protein